jgi:hypothetical protein
VIAELLQDETTLTVDKINEAIAALDKLIVKKRKANAHDKGGNRPRNRKVGPTRAVDELPRPGKKGPKIPVSAISQSWLESHSEALLPTRILGDDEVPAECEGDGQEEEEDGDREENTEGEENEGEGGQAWHWQGEAEDDQGEQPESTWDSEHWYRTGRVNACAQYADEVGNLEEVGERDVEQGGIDDDEEEDFYA